MFTDCCMRYFAMGESVCPVCLSQNEEHRLELDLARSFKAPADERTATVSELVKRRALASAQVGGGAGMRRPAMETNPNRRAVFRLLGIYLPEREAKALLNNVHEFKWIEAEKAGYDVWEEVSPRCPLKAAAAAWAPSYLDQFLSWRRNLGSQAGVAAMA